MPERRVVEVYCAVMKTDSDSAPELKALRRLPQVDKVLRGPAVAALLTTYPRWAVVAAVRAELDRLRQQLLAGEFAPLAADGRLLVEPERVHSGIAALLRPALRRVINATGVILHTNLGRAPLAAAALQRALELGAGYCNLEYQLDEGRRGSRQDLIDTLLAPLTGAEAHLVVNNNAAAVLLMLSGLCAGGEVVVSRGELVEIGGAFRVPEVMRASGAVLREVGTTNRTHRRDYESAVGTATRALLKVHRGNFAIVGFVAEVAVAELAALAHERELLCLYDLGSGALLAPPTAGSGRQRAREAAAGEDTADGATEAATESATEPTVPQAVAAGCDVVAFSCDKLLGGPQAGVLAGRREVIQRLHKHPLMRALRPDKLTLATLLGTLELYRDGRAAEIPTQRMMGMTQDELRARAAKLQQLCAAAGVAVAVTATRSAVGGGSLPLVELPSFAVSLPTAAAATSSGQDALVRRLESALRQGDPAVVARIADGHLLCDVRTVLDDDELALLAESLGRAWRAAAAPS